MQGCRKCSGFNVVCVVLYVYLQLHQDACSDGAVWTRPSLSSGPAAQSPPLPHSCRPHAPSAPATPPPPLQVGNPYSDGRTLDDAWLEAKGRKVCVRMAVGCARPALR